MPRFRIRLGRAAPTCAAMLVLGAAPPALADDLGPPAFDTGDETEPEEKRYGEETFWMNGGAGYGFFDLTTIEKRTDVTADIVASRVGGVAGNFGLGFRVLVATLGLRVTVNDLRGMREDGLHQEDFILWTLNGELGFKIPFGRLEPFFVLGGGYAAFGGFGDAIAEVGQGLDVSGADIRGGLGFDYYVTRTLSLGFRATGELLFLNRNGVPIRDLAVPEQVETVAQARERALEADGSSTGVGYGFFAGPGLHF